MERNETEIRSRACARRRAGAGAARIRRRTSAWLRRGLAPGLLGLLLATGTGCTREEAGPVVVVYSPHGREKLAVFERMFEARYPGVDVQWLDMGSQEVLDRLRSERANPQADVWWGAPHVLFEEAAREGLLAPFTPTWADALPEGARHPRDLWMGQYLTPEVIAFNSIAVTGEDVPRDWDDVLDPRWQGQVLIRDPLPSGTMRTIFGMIIHRSLRETGDTAAGFEWLRRLDAQTKEYVLNPTLLYQKLARREGLITLWDMPDIEVLRARTDLPIDYVLPSSGTPLLVDGVAVVAGARHPELAGEFVEFVGGIEALTRAAREFFRIPARTDFPADSLPERLRQAVDEIVPEPLDWELLQRETPAWMRHWDEHVRGRGRQ